MSDLENAKTVLQEGNYTCVLCKNAQVFTSTYRGVKPLVVWLEEKRDFQGFSAADKVVGKATAFLYLLLGIKRVYANVISRAALTLLQNNGVECAYARLTEYVINRAGDDICPFEKAVLSIDDKEIAHKIIRQKMNELQIKI